MTLLFALEAGEVVAILLATGERHYEGKTKSCFSEGKD